MGSDRIGSGGIRPGRRDPQDETFGPTSPETRRPRASCAHPFCLGAFVGSCATLATTMPDLDRPILESYWVLPGHLLAGEYPGRFNEEVTRNRLDALIQAGFNMFVDLTQPHENVPYVGILREAARPYEVNVMHQRFPIGDFDLPTFEQMNAILDALDKGLEAGHKVYLHCWGGIGRTGMAVGCYLVRQGRTGTEALDQLAAWWSGVPKSLYHPHSPETRQQTDFILHWAEHDASPPAIE